MGKDHPLWRKGVVGGHGGGPMARRTRMASQPTAASATEVARRHGAPCAPAGGARCVRASAATWRGRKGGSFAGCERAARVVSLLDGGGSGQPLIAGTTAVGGCQAANAAPPADHQPYRGPLVGSCGPLSFLRPIPFVVPVQRTGGPWGRVWFGIIALGVGCVAQLVVVSSRFHPDANTPPRPPAAVPSVLASCPGPCLA